MSAPTTSTQATSGKTVSTQKKEAFQRRNSTNMLKTKWLSEKEQELVKLAVVKGRERIEKEKEAYEKEHAQTITTNLRAALEWLGWKEQGLPEIEDGIGQVRVGEVKIGWDLAHWEGSKRVGGLWVSRLNWFTVGRVYEEKQYTESQKELIETLARFLGTGV